LILETRSLRKKMKLLGKVADSLGQFVGSIKSNLGLTPYQYIPLTIQTCTQERIEEIFAEFINMQNPSLESLRTEINEEELDLNVLIDEFYSEKNTNKRKKILLKIASSNLLDVTREEKLSTFLLEILEKSFFKDMQSIALFGLRRRNSKQVAKLLRDQLLLTEEDHDLSGMHDIISAELEMHYKDL